MSIDLIPLNPRTIHGQGREQALRTRAWWNKLVANDDLMVGWLQKLYRTEFNGYAENREAASQFAVKGTSAYNVLIKTGDDEMRHSELIVPLLQARGGWPINNEPPSSAYWAEMDAQVKDLETCAAVFHYGEKLAAERFMQLQWFPNTPDDIRKFLNAALPDESMHTLAFGRLAGNSALVKIAAAHASANAKLQGDKP